MRLSDAITISVSNMRVRKSASQAAKDLLASGLQLRGEGNVIQVNLDPGEDRAAVQKDFQRAVREYDQNKRVRFLKEDSRFPDALGMIVLTKQTYGKRSPVKSTSAPTPAARKAS